MNTYRSGLVGVALGMAVACTASADGVSVSIGSIGWTSTTVDLSITCPPGWYSPLNVYESSSVTGAVWRSEVRNLASVDGSSCVATVSCTGDVCFFAVASAAADADSDGLADGDERFVAGTCPTHADSDGDGLSDGYESHRSGTDPTTPDNLSTNPQAFMITSIRSLTNDDVELRFVAAVPPRTYIVQASENHAAWSNLITVESPGNCICSPVDSNAPAGREYRVVCDAGGPLILDRNAAGRTTVICPRGKTVLAGLPYQSLDRRTMRAADVFADQLPTGAVVSIWDSANQRFVSDTNTAEGWTGRIVFEPGTGFTVLVPLDAAAAEYPVRLIGEELDRYAGSPATIVITNGLGLVAYPFPMAVLWTNTVLAQGAPAGVTQIYWSASAGACVTNVRTADGWADPDLVLLPGMAFWYSADATWEESKPYSWP